MAGPHQRFLLYSHDTYGLGHFRRAVSIAGGIVASSPTAEVLIATGSPRAQSFNLPERVDSLKLPSVTKDGDGRYLPRKITADIDELVELRSSVLAAAYIRFRPDVIVVDQAPTGMGGELIPMLNAAHLCVAPPRLVLGLRDIVDHAEVVDDQWSRQHEWEWLQLYDDVLVYGDRRVLTTADELALHSRVPGRVTHTGFLAPAMPESSSCPPFVLVTPGGGGDGQQLIRRYLDAVDVVAAAGLRSLVVTGPLMSASRRAELAVRAREQPGVELIEFSDNMRQLVASSVGVVSMAGYNTVVEELASGTPAMLVPRTTPRLEQDIRARRLGPHSNLERCPLAHFDRPRLAAFVERASAGRSRSRLDLGGVARVSKLLSEARTGTRECADV